MHKITKKLITFSNTLKTNRRKWLVLGTIMLVSLCIFPRFALAAPDPIGGSTLQQAGKGLLELLSYFQRFLHSILWPVLLMIGSLLQNDLLYGGGMEGKLYDLWRSMRDIVNVFFVLVLIGIAFYNVVRPGAEGNFQLKTIMPKFVLAIIAVNFSYLGIKVALDSINVVTNGIFALPNTIQTGLTIEDDNGKAFCEGLYGTGADYLTNVTNANSGDNRAFCVKGDSHTLDFTNPDAVSFFNSFNSRNAALVLALNTGKLDLLNNVTTPPGNFEPTGVIINFMLSTTLYIIYAASYIALLAVLVVRLVMLWLMIVISPLIALKSVLPESIQSNLPGDDIGKKFIQHAIVPLPIALVLTIGFILLDAFSKTRFSDSTLTFSTVNISLLTSGIPTIQQLIAAIASIGFIWKGVFDAASQTYAASITDGIKGFVGGIGKFFGKLPQLIPAFPVGGGNASLGEVLLAGQAVEHLPDRVIEKKFNQDFPWLTGASHEEFGNNIRNKPYSQVKEELKAVANRSKMELGEEHVQKPLADYFKTHPVELKENMVPNPYGREQFLDLLEKGQVPYDKMLEFLNKNQIKLDDKAKTPAPGQKPGAAPAPAPAPGTPASATPAASSTGQELAKKQGMDDDTLRALQNLDQLKSKLSNDDFKKLDDLRKAINDPKVSEEQIKKLIPQDQKEKGDLFKRLTDASKAPTTNAEFTLDNTINSLKQHSQENFPQIEKAMQDEFQKLTNKPYNPNTTDKKDLEVIQNIRARVVDYFSDNQKKNMKNAEGYTNSLTSKILEGPPSNGPTPPSGKPPAAH